jgi:SAM-dependent methyltransferase
MTIWDSIYKNHQQGGEAWATLAEDIDPRFIKFIETENFVKKKAFDIGCGDGKYLAYLNQKGFAVSGIDSSETAIATCKEKLPKTADIQKANMFQFPIPPNTFDLILSISTIHHGLKQDVIKLIHHAQDQLLTGGFLFLTLPDLQYAKRWNTFKKHKTLGEGTYSPESGPEKGLPHSFFLKKELQQIFCDFEKVTYDLDKIGRWFITAKK